LISAGGAATDERLASGHRTLRWLRRGLAAFAAGLCLLVPPARAGPDPISSYLIDLGPPPATLAAAEATRPQRELAALQATACGREDRFRSDFIAKNVGEDVVNALTAKVELLRRGVRNCVISINQPLTFDSEAFNAAHAARFGSDCAEPVTFAVFEPASPIEQHERLAAGHIRTTIVVSRECLRRQVNLMILQMQPKGQIGSAGIPCHIGADLPDVETVDGDWDVSVRDLVRVWYLAHKAAPGAILDPATEQHLFNDLLTIDGPPGPDDYPLAGCGNTERSTGTPADRADERSWAEENFDWLSDAWDVLKWIGLILLLVILFFLICVLIFVTAGAGLPLLVAIPLLAAEVAVAAAVGLAPILVVIAAFIRIPETENHLLMINTSRYLINNIIIAADPADVEFFKDDQKAVKTWLLASMHRIATEDFQEYNARPYQRYSITALLNLHDFIPCDAQRRTNVDCDLKTATEIVLDLAGAKFAAGSSEGRRSVPFRRLMEVVADDVDDARRLTVGDRGSDHMFAFMLDYAGLTQHLPEHRAQLGTANEMVYAASSTYRPPPAVLSVALGLKGPIEQRIRHAGVEIYSSTPSFLISAGGVRARSATTVSIGPRVTEKCNDRGVALPTVLIPAGGGYDAAQDREPPDNVRREDLLRIEGVYYHYEREAYCLSANNDWKATRATPEPAIDRDKREHTWSHDANACVGRGFACGVNIVVPAALQKPGCFANVPGTPWSFLYSATCPALPDSRPFYVALYVRPCPVGVYGCGNNWGFFEAAEAPPGAGGALAFAAFRQKVLATNPAALVPGAINWLSPPLAGTYVSSRGDRIEFDALATFDHPYRTGVRKVNGSPTDDLDKWPLAAGDVITVKPCKMTGFPPSRDGEIEISGRFSGVTIDVCDWLHPKRTLH